MATEPVCDHFATSTLARTNVARSDYGYRPVVTEPAYLTSDLGWNSDEEHGDPRFAWCLMSKRSADHSWHYSWELANIEWQNMLFGQVILLWHRLHWNGGHQWSREFRDYVSQAELDVLCRHWEAIPRVPTRSGALYCL
jgi:hypothetical protein